MKKSLIIGLFAMICSFGVAYSQERLNEFVVEVDESHNPMTIYSSYGATPNDGVVIINSTISDLEFGIMSVAKERLRKVVPDKGKNRYLLIIQPNDSNYKQYTITINAKDFKQGKIDAVVVKAGSSSGYIVNSKYTNGLPLGTIGGHEYVDLGLPSGTLWATCNVGANAPEEYGACFAWGETQSYLRDIETQSPGESYKYAVRNGGFELALTKYCSRYDYGYGFYTDNLTELEADDDAASVIWGNDWRIPNKAHWEELKKNTEYIWITRNGVNGLLFRAINGKELFLPTAGYSISETRLHVGENGCYWSSTLFSDEDPFRAWYFYFDKEEQNMSGEKRYYGLTVRPVHSFQK